MREKRIRDREGKEANELFINEQFTIVLSRELHPSGDLLRIHGKKYLRIVPLRARESGLFIHQLSPSSFERYP